MNAQTINKELSIYFSLLNLAQKNSVLSLIKSFIQTDEKVKRITRKQYNKEILEAEKRVAKGHFVTEEAAEKELSRW